MEQHQDPPWDFLPMQIGAWLEREAEIDVMAIGNDAVLFGECKWTIRPVGTNILDDLKRKAYPLILRGGWTAVSYVLFSRAGFTPALETRAGGSGPQGDP